MFQWSEECQKAFQEVKNRLSSAPVLQPPDLTKPFYLWVDRCQYGWFWCSPRARQLAKKNIQKAQGHQKKHYDRRARDSNIQAGDLVMLKVDPRFKLDRGYKGPFRVNEVTPMNATIQMMNDPNAEPLVVSLQRLSLCNGSFSSGTQPWRGHCKARRRRKIRRSTPSGNDPLAETQDDTRDDNVAGNGQEPTRTCT